ncbi:SDR family oxidoreductase [Rhizobiaceae bacterium BDR2-2]|uniref:SDR family oxidoreductase n=1 Tax=Ectorhizobium quercum TaxID=2965071 RepID=A0AAE3STI5_9HYPH|nr:SDR family oxidoreductase [Ectorhizobium quercum]MCX8995723.1 SDR family oxidoreductase [Ectorhizobium quercum]
MNLLILGAGYSGSEIARVFSAAGFSVLGTTRSPEKAERLRAAGIHPFLFDGTQIRADLRDALHSVTHLVQSIAPDEAGDPFLRLAGDLPMPALEWIGYLSTVGVYGNHDGAWVDEETECRPVSARSRARVATERDWRRHAAGRGLPVASLRLSGIYGPGRNAFVNLAAGTARRIVKPGQVFNRIRVEDIGAAAFFLAERGGDGFYNVTDSLPAPAPDVVTEAARIMGVEPPPETPFDPSSMTPMARSFYSENKRVSNARINREGFSFRFPDYHCALTDLWESDRWRG